MLIKSTAKETNKKMEESIKTLKEEIKEEITKEIKEKEEVIMKKVDDLQDQVNILKDKVTSMSGSSSGDQRRSYSEVFRGDALNNDTTIKKTNKEREVFEKAANTIGLAPITNNDIKRLVRTQEIDTSNGPMAGLLAAVTEYLELELKLIIDELGGLENFTRIFKSKVKEDLVYVEFHNSALVWEIYRMSSKIPNAAKGNFQLHQYIPQ